MVQTSTVCGHFISGNMSLQLVTIYHRFIDLFLLRRRNCFIVSALIANGMESLSALKIYRSYTSSLILPVVL